MRSITLPAFLLCSLAGAQSSAPVAPLRAALTAPRWSSASDGSLWVRGADYKAGFDAEGARFVPFLGADAPRNFPLALRARGARVGGEPLEVQAGVAPLLRGEELCFERGGLSERYLPSLHALEQSFVFEQLPARGELVLEIAAQGELVASPAADGLDFLGERGGVHCGLATAVDARGARCAAPLELVEGGFAIRVPETFVATAELPLTIDPLVQVITLPPVATDDHSPDVVYDLASDRWVAVWEQTFSATDHDVVAGLLLPGGALITTADIDASTDNWTHPRVAANRAAGKCLVVAAVGLALLNSRVVRARFVTPANSTLTLGASFLVSGSEAGEKYNPEVGGDPAATGPQRWCVVWEHEATASQHDIDLQLIDATGAKFFTPTLALDSSGFLNQRPSIARSAGGIHRWHIAWQREASATNHDIYGTEIDTAGTLTVPLVGFETFTNVDSIEPVVSSPVSSPTDQGLRWLLITRVGSAVHVVLYVDMLIQDFTTLQELESSVGLDSTAEQHSEFSADSDGRDFLVAFTQTHSGAPASLDTRALLLASLNGALKVNEATLDVAATAADEGSPRVSSMASGGGSGVRFLVLDDIDGGSVQHSNIGGALIDAQDFTPFCFPGVDAQACPCGNPPLQVGRGCNNSSNTGGARLTETGFASLANDDVVFVASGEKPTATSIVLQGTAPVDASFGQGVRCAGGSLKRLYAKTAVGGAIQAPEHGDLSVSARSAALGDVLTPGKQRFYLVYYRDATVLGGCTAASTFNTTNSGMLDWRP